MMKRSVLICAVLMFSLLMTGANAAVIRVTTAGNDSYDGSTWGLAKRTIQSAIDAASSGDEIWVKAGTYKPQTEPGNPSPSDDRERHYRLKSGVALYGGFKGNETAREERDFLTNTTRLSGDIGTADDASDNCYHVVKCISSSSQGAVIDGFEISAGAADGVNSRGGGMLVENASPTIRNCNFLQNLSDTSGGALALWVSNALIENCRFTSNTGGHGGAVYVIGGTPEFAACTFQGNISGTLRNGGGLYAISSDITITNCTFYNNEADALDGGAIYTSDSELTLINSTVVENTAQNGGGLYWITKAPTIVNSIFWGNTATNSAPQLSDGSTVSDSVIEGGYSGANIVTADPNLFALADNGGPVKTMALPDGSSAHNIGGTSVAPSHDARGVERVDLYPDAGAFEYDTFRVMFLSEHSARGTLSGDTLQYIDINKHATAVTAIALPGYHFYRWELNGSAYSSQAQIYVTNITEHMNLTARFNAPPVALASAPDRAGTGLPVVLSGSGSYDPDNGPVSPLSYQWEFVSVTPSSIAAPVLTNADSIDASFSPDEAGTYTFLLTVDDGIASDTASVMVAVQELYTITATAGEGGFVSLGEYGTDESAVSETVSQGSDSSLIYAVPDTGFSFAGWSDASTKNPRQFTSVSADLTVTAEFIESPVSSGEAEQTPVVVKTDSGNCFISSLSGE